MGFLEEVQIKSNGYNLPNAGNAQPQVSSQDADGKRLRVWASVV